MPLSDIRSLPQVAEVQGDAGRRDRRVVVGERAGEAETDPQREAHVVQTDGGETAARIVRGQQRNPQHGNVRAADRHGRLVVQLEIIDRRRRVDRNDRLQDILPSAADQRRIGGRRAEI